MRKLSCIYLTVILLFLLASNADFALACPNCKENMAGDPTANGLARGFYYSILFMVSMPFLIFGSLSLYFYYLVRRAETEKQLATAQLAVTTHASFSNP
jgi:hypothetical protein